MRQREAKYSGLKKSRSNACCGYNPCQKPVLDLVVPSERSRQTARSRPKGRWRALTCLAQQQQEPYEPVQPDPEDFNAIAQQYRKLSHNASIKEPPGLLSPRTGSQADGAIRAGQAPTRVNVRRDGLQAAVEDQATSQFQQINRFAKSHLCRRGTISHHWSSSSSAFSVSVLLTASINKAALSRMRTLTGLGVDWAGW